MSVIDLLGKVSYLKGVDLSDKLDLIERTQAAAGEVIFAEGDKADAAFVIESGAVQVIIHTADGAEIVTARLEAGEHFGEQAFVQATRKRSATVRAVEPTALLRLPGSLVLEILAGNAQVEQRLSTVGQRYEATDFARQSALFKSLSPEMFQRLSLDQHTFAPGELVFAEGAPGDRVYLIVSGRAAVYKDRDGVPTLIALLGEGQCFGEVAVAGHTRRTATVRAEGALRTLSIDAASFSALLGSTSSLQQYLLTLQRIYQLPRRGFVTQGTGRLMGEEATTCIYTLLDGTTVMAARTIDGRMFSMRRGREEQETAEIFRFARPSEELTVELSIEDDRLQSITVAGEWAELATACDLILRGEPFDRWRAQVFSISGRVQLDAPPRFGDDEEVFCGCMQVRLGTIREAIACGAPDVDTIVKKTGCGTVCGACKPRLADLMGQGSWTPVRVGEVVEHTPDIRAFRLEKLGGGAWAPGRAGQHVVVEGLIDNVWVRRSYTLTSPPGERRFREITVKREPHGLFSSWLFGEAYDKQLLRISDPQGEMTAGEGEASLVCLVAGIGVTPALVLCRALRGTARRIHVDYSVRDRREAVCVEELEELSQQAGAGVSFTLRVTAAEGRLGAAPVGALVAAHPEATFLVCGPASFERSVSDLLRQAGVSDDRVVIERFTPAGGRVAAPAPKLPGERPVLPPLTRVALPFHPIKAGDDVSVFEEAKQFLSQVFYEQGVLDALPSRLDEVAAEIERTGSYTHTFDELVCGAKIAWRNSTQCVGRMFWASLQVRDMRHLRDEEEIFAALVEHLRLATNGGRIRPIATFLASSGVRILNEQIIRYAGYKQPDGRVIGDPGQVETTERALSLGWRGGKRTRFDLLPLMIQVEGRRPRLFELPTDVVLEVPFTHPKYRWWEELGLKWHAVPTQTDVSVDMGGVTYALVFNGWYMGAEIGSRNLCDAFRYDMTPAIAEKMGLDISSEATLWRDRAMLEMNVSVLHSFARMGVTLVDHHTVTRKFMEYVREERAQGRDVHANWAWVVPPLSGSLTPVFHVELPNTQYKPMLFRPPMGLSVG